MKTTLRTKKIASLFSIPLLMGLGMFAGIASPAKAATINVTTLADEFDTTGTGAGCSIREAVQAANTGSAFGGCSAGSPTSTDVINLTVDGTYTLTRNGTTNDNSEGDIDRVLSGGEIVINGKGPSITTIKKGAGWNSRIFQDITVLNNLTIDGSSITPTISFNGGCVFGGFDVQNVRFINCIANGKGGAIYLPSTAASFRILAPATGRNLFQNNSGDGGAIYADGTEFDSPLEVQFTDFISNNSTTSGGAIYSDFPLYVFSSYFEGNTSQLNTGSAIKYGNAVTIAQIKNTTFYNNPGNSVIYNTDGSATLTSVTMYDAISTAGKTLLASTNTGTFTLNNSIFGGVSGSADVCTGSAVTSSGYNIVSKACTGITNGSNNDIVAAPAINTTPTTVAGTKVLAATSSTSNVIDTGNPAITETDDQTGTTVRKIDGNGNGTAENDRGAYENRPDAVAPVISIVTAIPSPTNDTTPSFTFNSSEAGTILFNPNGDAGGACPAAGMPFVSTVTAVQGNNTVTIEIELSNGNHTCVFRVRDSSSNLSNILSMTFTVDTSFVPSPTPTSTPVVQPTTTPTVQPTTIPTVQPTQPPVNGIITTDVYRFYNGITKAHFFTTNSAERDIIISTNPNFSYENVAYKVVPTNASNNCEGTGAEAVYRFYGTPATGGNETHFFTINGAEADVLKNTDPKWRYEGIAWCAYTSKVANTSEIYRFGNVLSNSHFYTNNAAESDIVKQNPEWRFEGVDYYTYPNQ